MRKTKKVEICVEESVCDICGVAVEDPHIWSFAPCVERTYVKNVSVRVVMDFSYVRIVQEIIS